MGLKVNLTEAEKYGLSQEEIKLAQRWLRAHKTAGVIGDLRLQKSRANSGKRERCVFGLGMIFALSAMKIDAHC